GAAAVCCAGLVSCAEFACAGCCFWPLEQARETRANKARGESLIHESIVTTPFVNDGSVKQREGICNLLWPRNASQSGAAVIRVPRPCRPCPRQEWRSMKHG